MSVVSQTRTVQQSVQIIVCDGPECTVEHVMTDRYEQVRAPSGWYSLSRNIAFLRVDEDRDIASGPWHFHSAACLLQWTRVRAPADKEKAATP